MSSYSSLLKKELINLLEARDRLVHAQEKNLCYKNVERLDLLQLVFDTIDEPIYIVDLETDKIIFANKKIEALFGPVIGEYCWERLQKGQSGPCSFCTNPKLIDKEGQPTGVHRSIYQNSFINRWFQCSDQATVWYDGRMVAIKTSVDVSVLKETALSMNRLLEQNMSLAQKIVSSIDNERRQLSQDLHDEIGQIGTAIKLNADFLLIEAKDAHFTDDQLRAVKDIVKLSEQFLATTRDISTHLNPRSMISHLTVQEMLQGLFDQWLSRNRSIKGSITFDFDLNMDLEISLKEALYRVMQEALTNISRHSRATQVSLLLSISRVRAKESEGSSGETDKNLLKENVIELTIGDNGVGFPDEINDCCLGLVYMYGRVTSLGGQLQKGVSPLGGAQIKVQLPTLCSQIRILKTDDSRTYR